MNIKLSSQESHLLQNLIKEKYPLILPILEKLERNNINDDERRILLDAVMNEFCAKGLRRDDEPNDYGLLLESLLDKFNQIPR